MLSAAASRKAWKRLRKEAPIHWFDLEGGVGFWAVTRREDIVWISKQPTRFINAPRLAIFEEGAPVEGERTLARHLLNMDPPEQWAYRKKQALERIIKLYEAWEKPKKAAEWRKRQ